MFYAQNVTQLYVKLTMRNGEKLDFGCIFLGLSLLHSTFTHLLQITTKANVIQIVAPTDLPTKRPKLLNQWLKQWTFSFVGNVKIYYANCENWRFIQIEESVRISYHKSEMFGTCVYVYRTPLAAFMTRTTNRKMCVVTFSKW